MKRLYPRTRFTDINTVDEQFDHICQEYREAVTADDGEDRDAELADLEHTIQTYFDMRAEKEGIDVDSLRQEVIKKNERRGYYA